MTAGEFATLVSEMRNVQKKWNKAHSYMSVEDTLTAQKRELEKKVDKFLKEREARLKSEREQFQQDLFG